MQRPACVQSSNKCVNPHSFGPNDNGSVLNDLCLCSFYKGARLWIYAVEAVHYGDYGFVTDVRGLVSRREVLDLVQAEGNAEILFLTAVGAAWKHTLDTFSVAATLN